MYTAVPIRAPSHEIFSLLGFFDFNFSINLCGLLTEFISPKKAKDSRPEAIGADAIRLIAP